MTTRQTDAGAIVPSGTLLEEAGAILNRAYDVLMSDAKGAALIDALDPVAYDIERIKPKIAAALTLLSSNAEAHASATERKSLTTCISNDTVSSDDRRTP